ncbi:MAG: tRNA (N6-isopentenyl adenosine(37)-C2)-methylthiotransferase MiaB [Candidatus Omnitrophica bacterium 4484_213]|nr:MAG: tRNA (N6-isopentenyl adenosine(37)-C2)-methylthiotransferase MiaB [Candidatus Omnitrophica bacterium 4484_213]
MSKESKIYKNSPKKVHIRTFGCQMNEYDSEVIKTNLLQRGYLFTEESEEADVILVNGCSVREHAEERLWRNLENLRRLREEKPELIFGVLGCIAQNHKENIFKRFPFVNLVCGPHNLPEIFNHIENLNSRTRILAVDEEERDLENFHLTSTPGVEGGSPRRGYVLIMSGCNNFCSYCVVPYLRGREKSRRMESILEEVRMLVESGHEEITLLGQNVNSYRLQATGCKLQAKNNKNDFVELLREVNKIDGVEKISFATSHPKDASEELFKAMRDLPKVDKYLHLPFQSGSNRILKLMRRGYTREDYLGQIKKLKEILPQCKISTDVIVGFPGEREEDFQETKELMEEVKFDNAYIFKYSPRPGTAAARLRDDVPLEIKKERNQVLLELQKRIARRKNVKM